MELPPNAKNKPTEILIAEDSATQAALLQHLLEENGFRVTVAADGKQALAMVRERKPSLIVSDIVMPEMDGYALCDAIKSAKELKDIPVILLTSLTGAEEVLKALQCGADNIMRKPYDNKRLLSLIGHSLTNHDLRKQGKMQLGVEIEIGGEKHFITSERQQLLDLLLSTFVDAVELNRELRAREKDVARSYQSLRGLYCVAEALNQATREQDILNNALMQMMNLPGVQAGWVSLREGETGFRLAAACGLPPALETPEAFAGDCLCRRKLLAGEFDHTTNILECERLRQAKGDTRGLHYHASIPVRVGNRAIGVMNLAGPKEGLFDNEDLEILHTAGRQLALALERAQLLQQMEKKVEEKTASLMEEIAERKRIEEQFYQAQKMEAIGKLAGGIAHDFNNHLGIIIGYSERLLERLPSEGPLRKSAGIIKDAALRSAALTRQLLAFSRRQVFEPRILDLNAGIVELEKMLRPLIGEDIELILSLEPSLGKVKSDPAQVDQVIMNLVVNSRDAMPQGGRLAIETANVELDEEYASKHVIVRPGPYVMLAVTDTGVGMDRETQTHMFEPFFTTKEKGKGTGLGLATVYGIVKQSGGYIWVYSEPGKGTTFKIYLPRVAAGVPEVETERVSPPASKGEETVLVVEDEGMLRELACEFLQSSGYAVLEAGNGPKAVEISRGYQGPIHLLMTDAVMPGMSGRELAQRLHDDRPDLKVLYVSGYTDDAVLRNGLLEPGTAFLQKPFTRDSLSRKVREVLDREGEGMRKGNGVRG
ncbi:MAG: response regulator [Acidobacteria bacterium]|nr:response regulator [Acidobacteriota bacterium]